MVSYRPGRVMQLNLLKSKIHRAEVTDTSLNYEGSLAIDADFMDLVGLQTYERILVGNLNNGERFETYVIPGRPGSREFCLNGPTARKGMVGDIIIIFSYRYLAEQEIKGFSPTIIKIDANNNPI
jgi:aspartate 1-decarboxylase